MPTTLTALSTTRYSSPQILLSALQQANIVLFLPKALSMRIFLSLVVAVALAACGSESQQANHENPVEVKYSYVEGSEHGAKAKLGVKGMSCEVMCGGLIKKSLKKLDGVSTAEISFNPDSKEGLAEVNFDDKLITEKELVAAIEKLNEGQYKVNSVEVVVTETSYEEIPEEEEEIKATEESTGLDKKILVPSLPNIFKILANSLLR